MAHLTTAPEPRARHRRLLTATVVAMTVLVVGAGLLWSRRGADQASIDDATDRYQQHTGTTTAASILVPQPGVYRYNGSGTEQLSLLKTEQQWGPQLPATITAGAAGCWTFRIDYSTNHWQETSYCVDGDVLRETGGKTWQRFDFVATQAEDTVEFACDPPNDTIRLSARPGDVWPQACTGRSPARGTSVTSAGSTTFIGTEELTVGGRPVRVLHYLANRNLTGDQQGVESTSFWFAAETGQIIRFHRDDRVDSPSPIGPVTYTETGDFELADRQPVG